MKCDVGIMVGHDVAERMYENKVGLFEILFHLPYIYSHNITLTCK